MDLNRCNNVGIKSLFCTSDIIESSICYYDAGQLGQSEIITMIKEKNMSKMCLSIFTFLNIFNSFIQGFFFMWKQIRDIRDTNNVLPQSLTSQAGSFSVWTCHLLAYMAWTLKRLFAERTLTIKSTKGSPKSQILD